MSAQSIRPSQFITTYGPGAIIEGKNGPRLIPAPDIGLFNNPTISVKDYEIFDSRLSEGILNKARVFRLPSNAELLKEEYIPIYRTKIFPLWNLCINSSHHKNEGTEDEYILYKSLLGECPICKEKHSRNQQAVRFISACPEGHLDEFDWHYFIHNGNKCNHFDSFRWRGGGSSLSNIFLICPKCNIESKSLEQAYKGSWPCHGRFPEKENLKETPQWKKCESRAKIIQRQASNLRISDIVTLFTIPPRDTVLHEMLDNELLKSHILIEEFSEKDKFEIRLRLLEKGGYINSDTVNEILACSWNEILQAITDFKKPPSSSYSELISEELNELIKASNEGAPSKFRQPPSTTVLFEADIDKVQNFKDVYGNTLKATPISKLSEISVQLSYRRELRRDDSSGRPATSVDISFTDEIGKKWYPGIKLYGEGIFISTDNGLFPKLRGERAQEWNSAYSFPEKYQSILFRDENDRVELHPLFVYLHTLSHSIIRTISVDSGYSSTALRERVYLNNKGEKTYGGFLIYATQPGGDGTSGGLISLANSFQHIYDSSIGSLKSCSNDPLCIEDYFSANGTKVNGASCYCCTLISETSCEHRNMWLDRGLILENLS